MQPFWTEHLTRAIHDAIDGVTLVTRDDALRYIQAIPAQRLMTMQWYIAKNLLMAGSALEAVTRAIELALKFEGRFKPGDGAANAVADDQRLVCDASPTP